MDLPDGRRVISVSGDAPRVSGSSAARMAGLIWISQLTSIKSSTLSGPPCVASGTDR